MSSPTLFALVVLALAGCASPKQLMLVEPPEREAALYPVHQARDGVVVAVDAVTHPERLRQYFGTDLREHRILPLNVVVSNRSAHTVLLGPGDVIAMHDRVVVDPLPLDAVAEILRREHSGAPRERRADVAPFLAHISLKPMVLAPNQTRQGMLFVPAPQPDRRRWGSWSDVSGYLWRGGLRVQVGLTDAETGERLYFGPYSIALYGY